MLPRKLQDLIARLTGIQTASTGADKPCAFDLWAAWAYKCLRCADAEYGPCAYRCTLDKDPANRPTAQELLHHPWIRKFVAQAAQQGPPDPRPRPALLCKAELRRTARVPTHDSSGMRGGGHRPPLQRRRKSAKGIAVAAANALKWTEDALLGFRGDWDSHWDRHSIDGDADAAAAVAASRQRPHYS